MSSRLSIPRRVFLGFTLVLTVSCLVSVASIVQHQRTAATLSLLREGYLPLALLVSEGRATQSVLGNLLERVMSERNTSATRAWPPASGLREPVEMLLAWEVSAISFPNSALEPDPKHHFFSTLLHDSAASVLILV